MYSETGPFWGVRKLDQSAFWTLAVLVLGLGFARWNQAHITKKSQNTYTERLNTELHRNQTEFYVPNRNPQLEPTRLDHFISKYFFLYM